MVPHRLIRGFGVRQGVGRDDADHERSQNRPAAIQRLSLTNLLASPVGALWTDGVQRDAADPRRARPVSLAEKQLQRGYTWLVAAHQNERYLHESEFLDKVGWVPAEPISPPEHPEAQKSAVMLKRLVHEGEIHLLCRSDNRKEKDRAIRELHEKRLRDGLEKLTQRVEKKRLKTGEKVGEAIGRLRQRHSRVSRYYRIEFDSAAHKLNWSELEEDKRRAEQLDGAYLLK